MKVSVNGTAHDVAGTASLADIVQEQLSIPAERGGVAAALNGTLIPRGQWPTTTLAAGDTIEVVTAHVGG